MAVDPSDLGPETIDAKLIEDFGVAAQRLNECDLPRDDFGAVIVSESEWLDGVVIDGVAFGLTSITHGKVVDGMLTTRWVEVYKSGQIKSGMDMRRAKLSREEVEDRLASAIQFSVESGANDDQIDLEGFDSGERDVDSLFDSLLLPLIKAAQLEDDTGLNNAKSGDLKLMVDKVDALLGAL